MKDRKSRFENRRTQKEANPMSKAAKHQELVAKNSPKVGKSNPPSKAVEDLTNAILDVCNDREPDLILNSLWQAMTDVMAQLSHADRRRFATHLKRSPLVEAADEIAAWDEAYATSESVQCH
jgi:hypothetical protein